MVLLQKSKPENVVLFVQAKTPKCWSLRTSQNPKMFVSSQNMQTDFLQEHDKGHQLDVAILDFSKAFDTVPHNKLLHKLHQYGIKGKIHKWLTNFLTARSMRTIVEGEKSNETTVDSGVPCARTNTIPLPHKRSSG